MLRRILTRLVLLIGSVVFVNIILLSNLFFDGLLSSKSPLMVTCGVMSILLGISTTIYGTAIIIRSDKKRQQSQITEDNSVKTISEELIYYRGNNINLTEQIDEALEQLDCIKIKQEKLKKILVRKGACYDTLLDTGKESEKCIDKNMQEFLNRVIVLDKNDEYTSDFYVRSLSVLNRILEINDRLLSEFDNLLEEALNFNGEIILENTKLAATIEALRAINKTIQLGGFTDEE